MPNLFVVTPNRTLNPVVVEAATPKEALRRWLQYTTDGDDTSAAWIVSQGVEVEEVSVLRVTEPLWTEDLPPDSEGNPIFI